MFCSVRGFALTLRRARSHAGTCSIAIRPSTLPLSVIAKLRSGRLADVSIETIAIPSSSVNNVLRLAEGHFADLKAIDVSPAKLTCSLSAFANADGGELYVGIDENRRSGKRRWRGFASQESANGHVQAFEETFPLGEFAEYQFLYSEDVPEDGLVLKISIRKTPDIRTATNGAVYKRRGAQNLPVEGGDALRRLEYEKGLTSFETHPVAAPLALIANSETIIGFLLQVVPTAEPEPWLRKQLLISADKPTVASLLLFADDPAVALPKRCGVKIYRYATTEPEGSRRTLQGDPLTIEADLYEQVREAVAATVRVVEGISVMGPSGLEQIRYPEVTLHEIITNALLHRDYSIADDVHVRIFDNRIEVESPGRLPAHVTPQNILEQRFARNGVVVRWINKFPDPPNKDVGEGMRAAFDAMRELQLQEPEVIEKEHSVLVQIRHQRLASPEQMIVEYLKIHDEITNSIVRGLTGIGSENRVKGIFQRMIRAGELESIPGRSQRYAAYRMPPQRARG